MGQRYQRRNLLHLLGGLLLPFFLSGCLFTYIVRSGWEQTLLLTSRKDIEKVLKDPNVNDETKKKLSLALEIRKFSEKELGFIASKNYRTFVNLNKPYVTWIVTVAHRNKLENHYWKYPIIGKMPYKGFFQEDLAIEDAKEFSADRYDTWVRGVTAYSTLGWFEDPILSSMLRGSEPDLVELIIHESAHATLFFKNQADFNERLATFLGLAGTRAYYIKTEGEKSPALKELSTEHADEKLFSSFITKEIEDLTKWYLSNPNPSEDLRQTQFLAIQTRFKKQLEPKLQSSRYKNFGNLKLNNAVLLSLKTYVFDLSDFEKLFELKDKNFKTFLQACEGLKSSPDPNKALKELVSASP
jgi:predicted aminopeptidase